MASDHLPTIAEVAEALELMFGQWFSTEVYWEIATMMAHKFPEMRPLAVGDVLEERSECFDTCPTDCDGYHGNAFCGGTFGRDSYDPKTVEVIGADYVVVREEGADYVLVFNGPPEKLLQYRKSGGRDDG